MRIINLFLVFAILANTSAKSYFLVNWADDNEYELESEIQTQTQQTDSELDLVQNQTLIVLADPDSNQNIQNENRSEGVIACYMCTKIMSELIEDIMENRTKEGIEDALKQLCSKVLPVFQDFCLNFVEQYGTEIVAMIIADKSADAICEAFHICADLPVPETATEAEAMNPEGNTTDTVNYLVSCVPLEEIDMDQCKLCNVVFNLLAEFQNELLTFKVLQNVCPFMQKEYSCQCNALIQNFDKLFRGIELNKV